MGKAREWWARGSGLGSQAEVWLDIKPKAGGAGEEFSCLHAFIYVLNT